MKSVLVFVSLFFCLNLQAELIQEKSITLSGHSPEKWGLKHIKAQLGEGYFKFNELIDVKTTTGKISKKRFNKRMKLIQNLENSLLKNSKSDSIVCNRKLIIESKKKLNSKTSNAYCLDNLPVKDLALITKTIQQIKN